MSTTETTTGTPDASQKAAPHRDADGAASRPAVESGQPEYFERAEPSGRPDDAEGGHAMGVGNGGGRRPHPVAVAIGVLVIALVANLVIAGVQRVAATRPQGPAASSEAIGPEGFSHWATLLASDGHDVRRLRTPLAGSRLDPSWTVIVAGIDDLDASALQNLGRFLAAGGRAVFSGDESGAWLATVVDFGPVLIANGQGNGRPATPVVAVPEVDGVSQVAISDGHRFDPKGTLPILGCASGVVATVATVGSRGGRAVFVADNSMLGNRALDRDEADNTRFARNIAGPAARAVVFAEAEHGFGPASGPGAIPLRWRVVALGLALAMALAAWSRIRNQASTVTPAIVRDSLGRPSLAPGGAETAFAVGGVPGRGELADAMAAALARTGGPGPLAPLLRDALRSKIRDLSGLPTSSGYDEVDRAARHLGVPDEARRALTRRGDSPRDALAAAVAISNLHPPE